MGKIWLQTASGKLIHLPVVGDDVNSPADAVKIPVSVASTAIANRCLSGQVSVSVPTKGTVTIDFSVPGRTGSCNQCGQCCGHPPANCTEGANCKFIVDSKSGWHVCKYLTVLAKGVGKSGGTQCSLRATMLEDAKGCIYYPEKASEIEPYITACGFSFGA